MSVYGDFSLYYRSYHNRAGANEVKLVSWIFYSAVLMSLLRDVSGLSKEIQFSLLSIAHYLINFSFSLHY